MALFFTYVIAGLAVAMPVGPITVEMTKQGLKNGFIHGWIADSLQLCNCHLFKYRCG